MRGKETSRGAPSVSQSSQSVEDAAAQEGRVNAEVAVVVSNAPSCGG